MSLLEEMGETSDPQVSANKVSANRRNVRFPAEENTPPIRFVNSLGQTLIGKLVNESYGGVAATIACPEGLVLGQDLSVAYFGQATLGVLRRMTPEPDGSWLIAIEWK